MATIIDDAAALLAGAPRPGLTTTSRGPVEFIMDGDDPAVLALHGGMGGYDQGTLLVLGALERGTCSYIAPSRPDYLGTPLSSGATPEEQADLYAALLDTLGIAKVAVLAISGGGPSALQFALRHRDRCRGLVLISACTGPLIVRMPMRFYLLKLAARIPALLNLMIGRALRDPAGAVRRSIAAPAAQAALLADHEACSLLIALQLTIKDRLAARLGGTENDIKLFSTIGRESLARIAVPVLVFHGTADRVVSFDHAEAVAALVPGAELIAIDGGEHVSLFTHRALIKARTTAFLARLASD